jgi:hypothetical protein
MGLVIAFFLTVLSFPLALDGRDEEGQLVEVMRVKSSSDSELSGETGACREGLRSRLTKKLELDSKVWAKAGYWWDPQ